MEEERQEICAAVPVEQRVLNEIIQEVNACRKHWINHPEKRQINQKVLSLIKYLKLAINNNSPAGAAYCAFNLATIISKFGGVELAEEFYQRFAQNAANVRHAERQTLYARAFDTVKLELDGNCYPTWTHADFLNFILNKPEFEGLSANSLRDGIRDIFKARGLTDRIAKGKAQHVKRKK